MQLKTNHVTCGNTRKIEREMMTDFSNSKAMMDVIRKRKGGKVF